MIQNERGITLTELLITLAILSFAGVLIWSVFFQGYNYSQSASAKNSLQQEANLVIASLTNVHQTAKYYKITNKDCEMVVDITNPDDTIPPPITFKSTTLCYEYESKSLIEQLVVSGGKMINVEPFENNLDIKIIVSEKGSNPKSKPVDVDTVLYRIKEGGI